MNVEGNKPESKYMYEIIVETGPMANHATTSTIGFNLTGDQGESGIRYFNHPDQILFTKHKERVPFKKGGIDGFLLTTDHSLGSLNYFRVWNDNAGLGEMGAWYLMSVQVKDLQTGKISTFIANQWIAIDRGTFEDDVTLPASEEFDTFPSDYIMRSGLSHKFNDDHIWLSIFSRPIRSRFNRKQRVSVAMAMMMLIVMASGMFYDGASEFVVDPIGTIGFIPLDFRNVMSSLKFF